jgi:hypothetical protein
VGTRDSALELVRKSAIQGCRYAAGVVRAHGSSISYSSGRAVPVLCWADEFRAPVRSSPLTAGQARDKGAQQ